MTTTNEQIFSGAGIPIKNTYTPEDIKDTNYEKDIGLPGRPPFTRGVYTDMYRGRLWTLRQLAGFNSPEEANAIFRQEYELGGTGFAVAVDIPSLWGIDSDDPRAFADVGEAGVPICSLRDVETMFEGLPIDKISTWYEEALGVFAAMHFVAAEKKGVDLKGLRGSTAFDINVMTILTNPEMLPPEAEMRIGADYIEWCSEFVPKWHPACGDSYNFREQGINAVQELGLLLSSVIQTVEELKRRGNVPLEQAIRRLSFNMGIHNDFFEEIAKIRAARRIWYKIVTERYGIHDPNCWQFRVHVQSSGCTHTTQEPLNNIIRVAYQMLAGALGGAQSMHANGYDEGVCLPTDQSRLLSIRTGQILQFETGVTNTTDPLGGSYYIESLTNEIEERVWEFIKEVDNMGGLVEAIKAGWVHGLYRKSMIEHERKVASGEIKVVGVNTFAIDEVPYQVPLFRPDPQSTEVQIKKLKQLRKERDNDKVAQALKRLDEVTRSDANTYPALMDAVRAYATLGEIYGVWRNIYGVQPPLMTL